MERGELGLTNFVMEKEKMLCGKKFSQGFFYCLEVNEEYCGG